MTLRHRAVIDVSKVLTLAEISVIIYRHGVLLQKTLLRAYEVLIAICEGIFQSCMQGLRKSTEHLTLSRMGREMPCKSPQYATRNINTSPKSIPVNKQPSTSHSLVSSYEEWKHSCYWIEILTSLLQIIKKSSVMSGYVL
jgi:hypothetical protein